jgi:N-acetyl-beta-hexosaminidase
VQLAELSGDHDAVPETPNNCSTEAVWRVPAVVVSDSPALPYRGIMVDAARAYLPLTALKAFVALCRMYKLNYLHIHLSDDGAFTFPSATYPELARSSPFKYNISELHELQAYASVRGVMIVGEIDVPGSWLAYTLLHVVHVQPDSHIIVFSGHSRALTKTLPATFGFRSLSSNQKGICDFTR